MAKYTGGVVDCDIHHDWPTPAALYPYLSSGWREFVTAPMRNGLPPVPITPTSTLTAYPHGSVHRPESFPDDGTAAGSNYELMREQLLDRHGIERGLLLWGAGQYISAMANLYLATEVARAANDWCIDEWLTDRDDRLYSTILVANQHPEAAAEEIRRVGPHPRFAGVLFLSSGAGKPFGHPIYHPIYEAAAELDLPIVIHVGGESLPGQNVAPTASGVPAFYVELHAHMPQGIMTHMMSLIFHGVFDKYPGLRVVFAETGLGWVPWFLWRMDTGYKGVRREAPWMKKHPSEYFYEHIRMSTQPLDQSPEPEQLVELLKMMNGKETLVFSSDYPHWDGDGPDYVARHLPADWLPSVFRENAMKVLRFDGGNGRREPVGTAGQAGGSRP